MKFIVSRASAMIEREKRFVEIDDLNALLKFVHDAGEDVIIQENPNIFALKEGKQEWRLLIYDDYLE